MEVYGSLLNFETLSHPDSENSRSHCYFSALSKICITYVLLVENLNGHVK